MVFELDTYIDSLILNVDKNKIPPEINLCIDGGAFNGLYAWGIIKYIKALEKQNLTKVNKISGASIGSITALIYIIDNDSIDINKLFINMSNMFKTQFNLSYMKTIIKKIINDEFKDDNMDKINNRLFINYYDTKKCRNVIVSNYKNKKHLIKCLIASSFVPYIFNGNEKYKKRYIDGLMCHVFEDRIPNLFIRLITIKRIFRSVKIKCENNINNRILAGLADANDFFVEGYSDMCSYVENNYIYKLEFIFRQIILFVILSFIDNIKKLYNILPHNIKNDDLNNILNTIKENLMNYYLFNN